MNMNTIKDDYLLTALDTLTEYVTALKLYYKDNKESISNDILYADILESFKTLTREINHKELFNYHRQLIKNK